MTELRCVVVDDEPLARDELSFLLGECGGVQVVGSAEDADSALRVVGESEVDVVFVDLRMPGPDGLALTQALLGRHPDLRVIVVSAHNEALRAFEARAFDYLLKPVRLERLRDTIERLRAIMPRAAPSQPPLNRIAVRRRGEYVVLDLSDVLYFEARDEFVWAITVEDRFALDMTLSALESRLDRDAFFRCHRGFIVRVGAIAAITPEGVSTYTLRIAGLPSATVPLARERARLLRDRIPFAG